MDSPTQHTYDSLTQAYSHFNKSLFNGVLPCCLITMQRKQGAYGYFAGDRFGTRDGGQKTDEIALNPSHFKAQTTQEILSTLVHEMAHLWQHHFGKPGRTSYHNREWAECMRAIGLIPSDTGQPGGKETGQKVSHYIAENGKFAESCAELVSSGYDLSYIELWDEASAAKRKKKAASKTKYTCPDCSANAWAKPAARLICGDCEVTMEAEELEEAEA
jgi:predicted SprT family Zn-dependent metalloprotease